MAEIQKWIKTKLQKGEFLLSIHAIERSFEKVVTEADIIHCAKTAKSITFQADKETWKVIGKDLDEEKLTVICAVYEDILIVTIY